jgi:hypothetical protein
VAIKMTRDKMTPSLRRMARGVKELPEFAFNAFVGYTPFRTGNAISKTRLNRTVIEANYPYAKRLDEGYSKQARRGMTEPTLRDVKRYLQRTIRK